MLDNSANFSPVLPSSRVRTRSLFGFLPVSKSPIWGICWHSSPSVFQLINCQFSFFFLSLRDYIFSFLWSTCPLFFSPCSVHECYVCEFRTMNDNPRVSQSSDSNIGTASPETETTMTLENNTNNANHLDNKPEGLHTTDEEDASHQDIDYLYLDFDTSLPNPMGISSSPRPGQSSPPSPPSLKKYTSPFLWSKPRKTIITMISCCVTALSAYAAGEYTPPSEELTAKWHVSKVAYNVGITLFTLGFGIAPMVLAPFSEINGRRPIFVASGLVFTGVLWLVWHAV